MKCTPKKHFYTRYPCGEITCDCQYLEACKRIAKKLIKKITVKKLIKK